MNARDTVLARLRAATAGNAPAATRRLYRRHGDLPAGDPRLLELFAERLTDYRATVHRTPVATVAETVAGILAAAAVSQVVVPVGLPAAWLAHTANVLPDTGLGTADLDAAGGVITGAAVGIAETGTIVLDGSLQQGRRAITLLPDLHICVLEQAGIVGTVPEALAVLTAGRPLTWISGPSATSDIEFDRVEGVHGPRRLHVVVITEPGVA